ncbi:MAG: enoyl-CoA hydratase/isomerase family protein, partial [Dehalococcoidia bacterium]|nr:enoyl-CoA hydratase/isomerase family protein [Dehalococcoidia bacterium]
MAESESLVVVSVADGVGRLRLNRADKRNALNEEMSNQVLAAMQELELNDDVVCIVIEGTDGAFCAGADMAEANAAYEEGRHRINPSAYAADRVGAATKPTLPAIDGPAYGAGALLDCPSDNR